MYISICVTITHNHGTLYELLSTPLNNNLYTEYGGVFSFSVILVFIFFKVITCAVNHFLKNL